MRAVEVDVKESDTEPKGVTVTSPDTSLPSSCPSLSMATYSELLFEDFTALQITSPRLYFKVPIKIEIQKKSASKVVHSPSPKPTLEMKTSDITSDSARDSTSDLSAAHSRPVSATTTTSVESETASGCKLAIGSPAITLKSSTDGLAMAKRTSNCDAITLAFSTHKNSLFSCIAHACAGLSYAQVSFLAARSLKFSTPASDWKVGRELSRVQVATEYTFDLVSRRTAKEKTKSTLAALSERICAQIDKDQCVISNDDNGHFSLICGYNRHETEDGLRTFFLNQYFGKTPKDAALCYARVEVSTRKLFIFVGKQKYSAVKPSQQFHMWAKDAVQSNSFFLDVAYSRQKGMKTLLEGVGGFHRLMQRVGNEETPLELSRAIRFLMWFSDARMHTLHWAVCHSPLWTLPLQHSIQPLLALWRVQLELVKQTVSGFGCDGRTRLRLLQLLCQLSAIEVDAMDHLEAVLRTDDVWQL